VVPADAESTAIVLYPDTPDNALLARTQLSLVTAAGEVAAQARATAADSLECAGAPVVRLSAGSQGSWALGLAASVRVIQTDSIESLARPDSARLVANLARLASTVSADTETRFSGLPFAVVRARRFTLGNTRVVAAHLARKLPQEASPLEEHTFVIGERRVGADSLTLRFSARSEGSEETAERFEVLGVVAAAGTTLLLVARDQAARVRYEVLERIADGSWRVRWARPLGC
jgi:hypothetical protein